MNPLKDVFGNVIKNLVGEIVSDSKNFLIDESKAFLSGVDETFSIIFDSALSFEEKKSLLASWETDALLYAEAIKRQGREQAGKLLGNVVSSIGAGIVTTLGFGND